MKVTMILIFFEVVVLVLVVLMGGITINIPNPKNIQQNFINNSTALDTFLALLGIQLADKFLPIIRRRTHIQISHMNRFCF